MAGELRTMVRGDIIRHSKTGDPVTDEGSSTGFRGKVRKWDGFRPPDETVDDCQEILHAVRLVKRTH